MDTVTSNKLIIICASLIINSPLPPTAERIPPPPIPLELLSS